MNHDETNFNPNPTHPIEPELEARVVAWVLGEASPFEVAELERRCAAEPELAEFKRRMLAMHGLVREAARPLGAAGAVWRLAPERRAALLEKLREGAGAAGGEAGGGPGDADAIAVLPTPERRAWAWSVWVMPLAACLVLGGLLAALMLPGFEKVRDSARKPAVVSARVLADALEPMELAEGTAILGAVRQDARVLQAETVVDSSVRSSGGMDFRVVEWAEPQAQAGDAVNQPRTPAATLPVGTQAVRNRAAGADNHFASYDAYAATSAPAVSAPASPPVPVAAPAPAVAAVARKRAEGAKETVAMSVVAPMDFGQFAPGQEKQVQAWRSDLAATSEVDTFGSATGSGSGLLEGARASVDGRLVSATEELGYGRQPADQSSGRLNQISYVADADRADKRAGGGAVFLNAEAPVTTEDSVGYTVGGKLSAVKGDLLLGIDRAKQELPTGTGLEFMKKPESSSEAMEFKKELKDLPAERPVSVASVFDETLRAEVATRNEAVSTFSLHVGDASFRLAKAALERGAAPDVATIRPEEFYNAFDYGDPAPAAGEPVACRVEQAAHPFMQQRNLVRIALRVPAAGRGAGTPLNLTVLLDTSGSMEREDRAATVRAALGSLAALLGANDRVTLVGFARQPRLLVEGLAGDQAGQLAELAARTPAEGGTNLEEALKLAGELARRQWRAGAQNRIVLLTDGAANLGDADPARLATQVEALRRQGVAFDACGVGADGLDDGVLEALTRKGDGRYQVLNSPEEADAGFARKLAGAFRPAAENVKVQVRFNPERVARYRLVGFEKHRLREEDFRDDKVDAAELAAEEAAVALYQVEVIPGEELGELGDVAVRFRDTARGQMVERTWTLTYEAQPAAFDRASASLRLAGAAALLAEKLRGGAQAGQIRLDELAPVVAGLRGAYAGDVRVADFLRMFDQTRRLTGE